MATLGNDLFAAMLHNNTPTYDYNLWYDFWPTKATPTKTTILPFRSGSVATSATMTTMTTTSLEEERAHFDKMMHSLEEQQQRSQRNEEFWRKFPHLQKPRQLAAEKAAHEKAIVVAPVFNNFQTYSWPKVQPPQQQQQQLQNDREKHKKDDLDDSEDQRRRFWSTLTSKLPDDSQIKLESQLQHHLYDVAKAEQQQQQQQQQQRIEEAHAGEPPSSSTKIPAWARKRMPKTKHACPVCKKEFFKPHSVETHRILAHDASSDELTSNDESSFRSSAEREFRAPSTILQAANKLSSVSSYPYYDDGVVEADYHYDDVDDDDDDDVFEMAFSSNASDVQLAPPEFDERRRRIIAEELQRQQSSEFVSAAAAEKSCHLCKYCKLPFFYFNNYVEHLRAAHCFESELGARDTSTPMVPKTAGDAEEDSFHLPQPGTQLLLASSYKYEDDRKTPATPPVAPPSVAPSRLDDYDEEDFDRCEQSLQMPEKEQEQDIILNCVMCNTFFFSMDQLNLHVKQYHGCKAAL